MASRHDEVAKRIAKKFAGDYNAHQGVDVVTDKVAIEVETNQTISDAKQQLQGHQKPAYIAVTSERSIKKAMEATEGTTIGVIDPTGVIVKRSTRKRRR